MLVQQQLIPIGQMLLKSIVVIPKEHFLDGQLLFIQINHMIFVDIFGLRRQIEIIPIMCETLLFGLPIKYLTIQMVQHQHLLDFMEIGPIMAELIK